MVAFKKIIFWLHLLCGISLGLVVFIMSITGVVLTYEKQIIRWADGFNVRPPESGAAKLGPAALLATVHESTGRGPTALQLRASGTEPARVFFGRETMHVDPYTGETLGEGAVRTREFFHTMIVWHRWLGQEGDGRAIGKAITGACNLGFLILIISGAYLWWPKRWTRKHLRPISWFRFSLPPKARDFNWHNVFGAWCAIPLFAIVATATFFSYGWTTDLLYVLTGEDRAAAGSRRTGRGHSPSGPSFDPDFTDMDRLLERAIAAQPDWRIATIRLPGKATGPVTIQLDRGSGFRPDLRASVRLDRATGEVVGLETYAEQGTAQKVRSWVRWIHTGEAGGWAGQTVAGIASLAACLLVYTGCMLSWRRYQAWRHRRLGGR